jgi:DNA-binding NarL/FixJ family response regulator
VPVGEGPIRVVVADDQTYSRDLLRRTLEASGVHVVGETVTCAELVALCAAEVPDVVVTDIDLADGPVEGCLGELAEAGAAVLVFCDDPSPERVTAVLVEHAAGYLLRDASPARVVDAVRTVAAGGAALDPLAATTILGQWRRLRSEPQAALDRRATLTRREQEVLAAMADGLPTKAIARRLGVALKTVENHKLRVFDKLGVRTHAQAVSVALAHGLISAPLVPTKGG